MTGEGLAAAGEPPLQGGRRLEFIVGGNVHAVPAAHVREIVRRGRITPVPLAPDSLLGLASFRGSICPVLSFGCLVDATAGAEERLILLDKPVPLAIAVDAVRGLQGGAEPGDDEGETGAIIDVAALIERRYGNTARRGSRALLTSATDDHENKRPDDGVPLLVFAVADQSFAMPVDAIVEVAYPAGPIAIMPDADAAVLGTVVLRDMVLPLLSLSALLGLDGDPDRRGDGERTIVGRGRPVVVMRIGVHRVGLVVDRVNGMFHVAASDIDPVPMVIARGTAEARIQAICRLEGGRRLVSVLAPDHLVRQDLTEWLLRGSGDLVPDVITDLPGQYESFLQFRIGDQMFGLPIASIVAVTSLPDRLTTLPGAPPFMKGAMSLRGEIVPVIDQVRRFGNRATEGAGCRVIVVRLGRLLAGFQVDAVTGVVRVARDALQVGPDLAEGNDGSALFESVASMDGDDRLMLVISPAALLDGTERDLLLASAGGKAAIAS